MAPHGRGGSWRGASHRGNRGNQRGGGGYGHDGERGSSDNRRQKRELTAEEEDAKEVYSSWKRFLKHEPRTNDITTMERLWSEALDILNSEGVEHQNSKQMVARDLDSGDLFGREHIQTILCMKSDAEGATTFVKLVEPFLLVITHHEILACLSVDTAVGSLYNFISGSTGSRAIPFFRRLLQNLPGAILGREQRHAILITLCTALQELLKREQRARFHDDLQGLIESIEPIAEALGIDKNGTTFGVLSLKVKALMGIVSRAHGLLHEEVEHTVSGVSATAVTSTYPRAIIVPGSRHDNDKSDIADISIIPTEGEIRSNHAEFLPSTDLDQPHFLADQAQRHIDTHFRLLRHDIFGELKDSLSGLITAVENDPTLLTQSRLSLGNTRAYLYPSAFISYLSMNDRHHLEAQISFTQPPMIRKRSKTEISRWWAESRRLEEGVLLCFVSCDAGKASILFFNVSGKVTDSRKPNSLANDHHATTTGKLASLNQSDLESAVQLSCSKSRGVLIELPGVILATFKPILENLQDMQRLGRLPFQQWIVPEKVASATTLEIPPPMYSRKRGFRFSLKSILKNANSDLHITSDMSVNEEGVLQDMTSKTALDHSQCQALLAALLREFAHIQGPPGTGKSYVGVNIMRVLLDAAPKANLGPIIVVCYTNHALDQFLEHLLEVGVEKIIRIGSGSKSESLEGKNLRVVAKAAENKTGSEKYVAAMAYKELEAEDEKIERLFHQLHGLRKRQDWNSLKDYIRRNHNKIHSQFNRVDEEGFESVGREPFAVWITTEAQTAGTQTDHATIQQLHTLARQNIWSVSLFNRRRLVQYWVEEIYTSLTDQLYERIKSTEAEHQRLGNVHDEVDRRILQDADVIGITTSTLARRIATFQNVSAKVIIVEEAGEIMESHMLSALLPSIEHVIAIGDHKQLRPQINNFNLSLESQRGKPYQLDRSQFERLSDGTRFPIAQLIIQRRMRPQISKLIKSEELYPTLIDHKSTLDLPDVVGIRNNVFWMDHKNIEDSGHADHQQKSHSNVWEVDMVSALLRHLVRQGVYSSRDIAVLTPYTGQLQKLRARLRNEFEIVLSDRDIEVLEKDGFLEDHVTEPSRRPIETFAGKKPLQKKQMTDLLRLATIDNFQGEEAQVVIVSLVRSNGDGKVGFLKTTNRINVLLSRAQHGLYLIGNAETYTKIPMWQEVQGILRADDSFGPAFNLCCPRHVDTVMLASQPDDFARLSPEGGCQLACDKRLDACGHMCTARCHSESMHQVFSCPKPCERLHSPCNHSCQKETCGEDCGRCLILLNDIVLPCGHANDRIPCWMTQDLANIPCATVVQKDVPGCNHTIEIQCSKDVTVPVFKCTAACGVILECGHVCSSTCGRCNSKGADGNPVIKHAPCSKVCDRAFGTCNHRCTRYCHVGKVCGPCFSPCEVRCAHSTCSLKCHEPCAPCIEKCTWSCPHQGECTMPCSAPCNRLPCNERCREYLTCDHQCPSICGEICPEGYCQVCCDRQDARVDILEMKTYCEINLDESPIVVLSCGHFFTTETLDGMLGISEAYLQDQHEKFIGLKDMSAELAMAIPKCPDCNTPIRQFVTQRYNRVINRAVIDEMSKRFLVSGKEGLQRLEGQIEGMGRDFEDSLAKLITEIGVPHPSIKISDELKIRNDKSTKLRKQVDIFINKVANKNQPAQKLHDSIISAARQRPLDEMLADMTVDKSVPTLSRDRRITLGGQAAQLKASYITLSDRFPIAQAIKASASAGSIKFSGGLPDQSAKPFFTSCKEFISACKTDSLPKLAVECSIYFANIARLFDSYCRATKSEANKNIDVIQEAKDLLENALVLCNQPFQNAEVLRHAVEECQNSLRKEWYEPVTAAEIAAIKAAMVSGPRGIATHSGHWYNCENGHPFAIGECGMPMEEARCPECGAPVGGSNHRAVDGVTRARDME